VKQSAEGPAWRKSSYSDASGNACVEVAAWRKSSYSSPSGNACVEVGDAARVIIVRDTTDCGGVTLSFPAGVWQRFTGTLAGR
jgi:hypothetical protein